MMTLSQILEKGVAVALREVAVKRVALVSDINERQRWTADLSLMRSAQFVRTAWMVETLDVAGRSDRLVQADYRAARAKANAILRQCGAERDLIPVSVENWSWNVAGRKLTCMPSLEPLDCAG